jgi:hypothetical protein
MANAKANESGFEILENATLEQCLRELAFQMPPLDPTHEEIEKYPRAPNDNNIDRWEMPLEIAARSLLKLLATGKLVARGTRMATTGNYSAVTHEDGGQFDLASLERFIVTPETEEIPPDAWHVPGVRWTASALEYNEYATTQKTT